MKSLPLGTYADIPVKLHWSFGLIILFIAYVIVSQNLNLASSIGLLLYVFSVFLSVLLHEYGHALMARRYDIKTFDIVLTPIGGLARLTRMPTIPGREIMIAIAGPLVNLVIILLILIILFVFGIGIIAPDEEDIMLIVANPIGFLHMVMLMNGVLFLFNLIPAFPMDGGRIFRALLSYKLTRLRATFIASLVGRAFAIGFIIFAYLNDIFSLGFIGVFIFLAAGREYNHMKMKANGLKRKGLDKKKLEH